MASFQAKIDWKGMRKRENKNYSFVLFLPDAKFKIPKKNAKKFQKIKNASMASFEATIGWRRMWKEEKKNYRFVSLLPDAL